MGAVSPRSVGLPRRRVDLGQLRALGLAALPLRALDLLRAPGPLGLGARGIQPLACGARRLLLGKRLRRLGAQGLLRKGLSGARQHDRGGSEQRFPELESTRPLQRADRRSWAQSGKRTRKDSSRGLQRHRGKFPSGSPQRTPASACAGAEFREFEKWRPLLEAGFQTCRSNSRPSRERRLPAIDRQPFRSNRAHPSNYAPTVRFPATRPVPREPEPLPHPGLTAGPFLDFEP